MNSWMRDLDLPWPSLLPFAQARHVLELRNDFAPARVQALKL
jgi:hypothetical protein